MNENVIKEQKNILKDFLEDDEELHKIESLVSNFNIFETIGIEKNENRHSNILAWLLNPKSNHNLGDLFLRYFLKDLFLKNDIDSNIDFFEIALMDFDDIEIIREYIIGKRNRIDILIKSEQNNLLVIIENKIDSTEGQNQLKTYFELINSEFPKKYKKKLFVYLTKDGSPPSNGNNWYTYAYHSILQILEKILNDRKESIPESVFSFVNQYKTILRRYIVDDSEIKKLCENIYKKHQKALDLIFQYKPDIHFDIQEKIIEIINGKENLILDFSTKTAIRFTTRKLDGIIPQIGEGWTTSKRILLFEFKNFTNADKSIYLIIGPSENDSIREKLYSRASEKKLFNIAKSNFDIEKIGTKWSTIYKKKILLIKTWKDEDTDTVLEKLSKELNDFFKNDLVRIEEHFKDFTL